MTEPLVSVKMITYNHAPYIAQAIEGVVRQKTNFPFELVIGEDCSTDGTREIVFDYQKKFPDIIRVITSDENVGMKRNGSRTTKACKGKYLAWCEGDDYWHHAGKLQLQTDYLESHPECGLVYSDYDICYVKSGKRKANYLTHRNWHFPETPTVADFVEGIGAMSVSVQTCTVMMRRELYRQIVESDPYLHLNDRFPRGDTQLWAEAAHISRLHYIPESLSTYNMTDESATRSKDIRKLLLFHIGDAELGLYLCDKYNLPPHIKIFKEDRRYNSLLRLAFYDRNAKLAQEVRTAKTTFTWKEWLEYLGARNPAFYYVCRIALSCRSLFATKHGPWR
jgi:glycosyltransferase involved in cell wall biosynthesis